MTTSPTRTCDVAIVGAGLAGLSAARTLVAQGVDVVVLEARDRVGGRLHNHRLSRGEIVEIGGQWVGPTQREVMAWIRELGLTTYPTHDTGLNLFERRGRLSRYSGAIPRLGPAVLADVGQAQARLDRMARRVPLDAPWRAPRAEAWDRQTVATWIARNTATRGARDFFQLVCEGVWASDPADLSLLHFLFYVHSGGGIDTLISTGGGAQQDRVVGGSQLIAVAAAEPLGDRLVLSAPARRVLQDGDGVTVQTDGLDVRASRVVVAIPPTLAARIDYEPILPGTRDQLTQRMPQGTVVKCMAVYDEPFWRADGFSGQVTSTDGPVKVVFDNTPHGAERGVLLGFLEGPQARAFGRVSPEERRDAVVECFARFFGPRAATPVEYVDRAWAEEEFSRGCYGGYLPPGVWTSLGGALREPCGRVHWAGTETAEVWNGYMDGAISSGARAAREVLAAGIAGPVAG